MEKEILKLENIFKTFPGVQALSGVNMSLREGECLGLCGENGAGKSTICKIISGVQKADPGGHIYFYGKEVEYDAPIEAKSDGIIMIYQELSLVMDLSVAENIFLGNVPRTRAGLIDWKTLKEKARAILEEVGLSVDPMQRTRKLPMAQQQLVEIARALALESKVVIFDEPTSSLTEKEKHSLFEVIRRLKSQGHGIIYISHRMDEIKEITDRVLVLRDGKNSGEYVTAEVEIDTIIESMIGRPIGDYFYKCTRRPGAEVLRVENLSRKDVFSDISFHVDAGEVVGLYGLVGAGRTEIIETLFGLYKKSGGNIYFQGDPVNIHSPADAVKLKIGLCPENRKTQGLVLRHDCENNIIMAIVDQITNRCGFIRRDEVKRLYEEYKKNLDIKSFGAQQLTGNLSGGNQQKIVLAKWLCTSPVLLILDEPTRGIDVGSKAEIHRMIANMAEDGMAIIVISSEMPEIIGISNRIYTISHGQLTGELVGDEINEENIIQRIMLAG